MGLNETLQGKTYPPVVFEIKEERARAFAAAVAHKGAGVPPTLATAPEIAAGLANVIGDPELGLQLSSVLHGEQEYVWTRALLVGETVSAEATIESIRGRASMLFLTLRTLLRDEAGETVVVGRSTLIVREDG
ncbi:MAG TPA: MaoC family dehydratase N-terminal domain-containing protein [Actinomycetota bacterium]|nr:MaoC family dehydratase N-terminal domain-containing protein [Actinomycetota bacterium]